MNTRTASALISLAFFGFLAGCGGGGSSSPAAPTPPPQPTPPVVPMSAAGIWVGEAVTPDVADIVTSFEFNDSDGFVLGNAPFTADFQGGVTESRQMGPLYSEGLFSWHINTAGGSIDFAIPGDTLVFSTRTVTAGDNATVQVLDQLGAQISLTVVTNAFQQIVVNRNPGQTLIGSVVITVTTGEIVIDSFTFGFPSTASTDDIACLFAPPDPVAPAAEDPFICVITDATGALIGSANGTYEANGDVVTGTGSLYAAPGETLADGSTVADLTISAGTVVEATSLNVTVDSTGLSIAVTSLFDDTYDRASDLSIVAAVYADLEIFGDTFSLTIDGAGMISGLSMATGCVLSGQVAVIDPAANIYGVNLVADAGTCGALSGNYDGLGSSQDDMLMDDQFIFAVFVDGVSMIVGQGNK